MKVEFDELQKAAEPVVDLLKKKGHPHMKVIIEQDHVELVEGLLGIPVKEENG